MLKMLGIGVGVLSLVAFVACAEGPKVEGDYSALTAGDQNAAEPPPEKASLPAPTNPTPNNTEPKDPPKEAGPSTPPVDAGSSSSSSGSSGTPTAGEDCPLDPVYIAKLAFTPNPPACPCAAGQCCVQGQGCVAK
jgi:hypothetical protein